MLFLTSLPRADDSLDVIRTLKYRCKDKVPDCAHDSVRLTFTTAKEHETALSTALPK